MTEIQNSKQINNRLKPVWNEELKHNAESDKNS
jgi:hypothetical protein